METIKLKIKELLKFNDIDIFDSFQRKNDDPLHFDNIMKTQETLMEELKTLAKTNNTLLGRTIQFPMADSYALYVVTKVGARTVEITWVKYCDGHQDDRAGYCSNLNRTYAEQQVFGKDRFEEYLEKRKLETQS
jgi:hypothetical protein